MQSSVYFVNTDPATGEVTTYITDTDTGMLTVIRDYADGTSVTVFSGLGSNYPAFPLLFPPRPSSS